MADADQGIRVGVRCRPLVPHEKGQKQCFSFHGDQIAVVPGTMEEEPKGLSAGPWRFDASMDSTAQAIEAVDNVKCYQQMGRNIIDHALEGYNACLFCYGQTGTGKTTTILGDERSGPGILILMLKDLFEEVAKEKDHGGSITVSVQMLEVYNEKIFDLLVSSAASSPAKGRAKSVSGRKPKTGADLAGAAKNIECHVLPSGVQVKGAETIDVESVDDVMKLINQGSERKHIAETAMNPQSSRGHTVFKIGIHKDEDDLHMSSEVYFADLAGHESEKTTLVTGDRLVELSYINKSLMWLQAAVHALASQSHKSKGGKQTEVSSKLGLFRNSKLTLLMANALTGNSLVNVIVTISPAAAHFTTSISSLKFANEVKHMGVEVHSSAHQDPAAVIKKLEQEVNELKLQLARAQGSPGASTHVSTSSSGELEEEQGKAQPLKATTDCEKGLHSEIEELRKRGSILEREKQALVETVRQMSNGQSPALPASMLAAGGGLSTGFLTDNSIVFSADVAKSLDAIRAKVSELQQDLCANGLSTESVEVLQLLDCATNLTRSDPEFERLPSSPYRSSGTLPLQPGPQRGSRPSILSTQTPRWSSPSRSQRPGSISPQPGIRAGSAISVVSGVPGTLPMSSAVAVGSLTMSMATGVISSPSSVPVSTRF